MLPYHKRIVVTNVGLQDVDIVTLAQHIRDLFIRGRLITDKPNDNVGGVAGKLAEKLELLEVSTSLSRYRNMRSYSEATGRSGDEI